jgi:cytidylate kinase
LKIGVDENDPQQLTDLCEKTKVTLENIDGKIFVFVDHEDVGNEIRSEEVGLKASKISASPIVRTKLLAIQREAGGNGGLVAEGRDMGSVVFPNADYKFFLDADIRERTRRRHDELLLKHGIADRSAIMKDMQQRDLQDSQREVAPLKVPPNAIIIDTTYLSVSQVLEKMLNHIRV